MLAFPANRGWGTRRRLGAGAQPFAKLFGGSNDLRGDREMYFVELLQAALHKVHS